MDVHNPQQRSKNMRAIKSTATKVEIILGKALWNLGYRYRKNNKTVFGKPDFTFKKLKIAIFIDSEFFHGKDWETRKKPQTNAEFWIKKIERNMQRDIEVTAYLESQNWKVLRFWSKEIAKNLDECVTIIENEIALRSS
ncbi:T/G mismatch-specific endonuclease [Flavobacterium glycines]|uniref:Very short patch repair endonuclease n=1 Tax=Flavobacterium glycines TaxID=551990 RepID=A0A1B9DNS1_9FLAO|nr:very short patch repair endonuclease [Flavobacterium glycines]OCB71321.1 very short patch repair endonuclease [Flavobacterium glycines]GEL10335.1 very short patch repair endonuclease [Flavobacterium glycines]SDI71958.1 T/G mismatch-specific endonuclease [Flavobacterium glycines]